MWTGMKVFIELRDGVSLLLPFREASKVRASINTQRTSLTSVADRTGSGMAKFMSQIGLESARLRQYTSEPVTALLSPT